MPVFGPWSGTLDDDGETLKLLRPGTPELDGTVDYYRVDHVTCRTNAEFSAADDPACGALAIVMSVFITVNEANRPPSWVPQTDVWFPAGLVCAIPLSASDPDLPAQALSFQAAGLPTGFHLETSPLRIAGVGVAAGTYPIEVTVSDGQTPPLQDRLQFAIHLTEPFALGTWMESEPIWLNFPAIAGETYRVEWCDDLAVADWRILQAPAVAQTNVITVFDPAPGQSLNRFYRVHWMR